MKQIVIRKNGKWLVQKKKWFRWVTVKDAKLGIGVKLNRV